MTKNTRFIYKNLVSLGCLKAARRLWIQQKPRTSLSRHAGITEIYSTNFAFMALDKVNGKGFCWGVANNGGECSHLDFKGVTDVYSTNFAFFALKRSTGTSVNLKWVPEHGGGSLGIDHVQFNFTLIGHTHFKNNVLGELASHPKTL